MRVLYCLLQTEQKKVTVLGQTIPTQGLLTSFYWDFQLHHLPHADRSVDLLTSKISSSYDFSSTLSWALISWWSLCDVVKSSRPGKSLSCFWVQHCSNYQRFLSPKTRSSPATVDFILLSELILPIWTASLASDCLFDCCSLIVWLLNFVVVQWLSLLPRSKKVWTVRGSRRL